MSTIKIERDHSKFKRILFISPITFITVGSFIIACFKSSSSIYKGLGILGVLFVILLFVFFINAIKKIRNKSLALELNEEGIIDNISIPSSGLIKWEEIVDAKKEIISNQPYVLIRVLSPQTYIEALEGMKKNIATHLNKKHGSPILIDINQIKMSADNLIEHINKMKSMLVILFIMSLISCQNNLSEDISSEILNIESRETSVNPDYSGYLGSEKLCGTLSQESFSYFTEQKTVKLKFIKEFDEYQRISLQLPSQFDNLKIDEVSYKQWVGELQSNGKDQRLISWAVSRELDYYSYPEPKYNYCLAVKKEGLIELDLTILAADEAKYRKYFEKQEI